MQQVTCSKPLNSAKINFSISYSDSIQWLKNYHTGDVTPMSSSTTMRVDARGFDSRKGV